MAINAAKEIHGSDKEYYIQRKFVGTVDGEIGVVHMCCTEDYCGNEIVFVHME